MYTGETDNIIGNMLDRFHSSLQQSETYQLLMKEVPVNYVQYASQIISFIIQFRETINGSELEEIVHNPKNVPAILDCIEQYCAYYYFLQIAYYYQGNSKQYASNLIQCANYQKSSSYFIQNFFNAQTNQLLLQLYKLTKEVASIIVMTDLQKETLDKVPLDQSFSFIDQLGTDYVATHLITVNPSTITINVHNLIKTILLKQIYDVHDAQTIYRLLTENSEEAEDYIFIDVVVAKDYGIDVQTFKNLFIGRKDAHRLADRLVKLTNEMNEIPVLQTDIQKTSKLFSWDVIYPVVDDFLRYHSDTQSLEVYGSAIPIVENNTHNLKLALVNAQRRKTENTRAELIVNSIDAIADQYSTDTNKTVLSAIHKVLTNPFDYRTAVLINYLDEMKVLTKIKNSGSKALNENEYYLELQQIMRTAYYNFRSLEREGAIVTLYLPKGVNVIRYSNIKHRKNHSHLRLETYVRKNDANISLVGLAVAPLVDTPIQCIRKRSIVNIKQANIYYSKEKEVIKIETTNGYRAFLKLIKYFYVRTIRYRTQPVSEIYVDLSEIAPLNRSIAHKLIYWNYDSKTDIFESRFYEQSNGTLEDTIKFMNVALYDKIIHYLSAQLVYLIHVHRNLSSTEIERLIILYSTTNKLNLSENDRAELMVKHYFNDRMLLPKMVYPISNQKMPLFSENKTKGVFKMRVNMLNPLHITKYSQLNLYALEPEDELLLSNINCIHEEEWSQLAALKTTDIHQYNVQLSLFMQRFAFQTAHFNFVCKICNQVLAVTQFSVEGSYDDNTEQFVNSYTKNDLPLEEMKEYVRYKQIIKYLTVLVYRLSVIAHIPVLSGNNSTITEKRKDMVKLMFDLALLHNNTYLKNASGQTEDYYAQHFNIIPNLDIVQFFEIDDKILNGVHTEIGTLAYNNLLLYLLCVFLTQLNASQIAAMAFDKTLNIYTFLKYGKVLFGNLRIKQNINSTETAAVTDYPVLCYLIYSFSYYFVKYGVWIYPEREAKKYDPNVAKIIIHSFIHLWNSLSLAANNHPQFYTYSIIVTRLYTALNNLFVDQSAIKLLQNSHSKYANPTVQKENIHEVKKGVTIYNIGHLLPFPLELKIIRDYQASSGMQWGNFHSLFYTYEPISSLTRCDDGSFRVWEVQKGKLVCTNCNDTVDRNKNLTEAFYYYSLESVANRRCLGGTLHDFIAKGNQFVCTICNQSANTVYSRKQLDTLASNLNNSVQSTVSHYLKTEYERTKQENEREKKIDSNISNLVQSYLDTQPNRYGQTPAIVHRLTTLMQTHLGENTNLNIDKYPVYLQNNVYVIDHLYNEVGLDVPIIVTESENKIKMVTNDPYFKIDVYYYTDYGANVDVFYNAITKNLIGYKEKLKDYTNIHNSNCYLKVSLSVADRLVICGYDASYVQIDHLYKQNEKLGLDTSENYAIILHNLIRDHLTKTKLVFDKIVSTLFKIKYYVTPKNTDVTPSDSLVGNALQTIVHKYAQLVGNLEMGDAFVGWADIRETLIYHPVDWSQTDIERVNTYVSAQFINFYDFSSNVLFYYLIHQLIAILDRAKEEKTKISICNMYVQIINYVYSIYNVDPYIHTVQLKRFNYILTSSSYMIDTTLSGEGLNNVSNEATSDDNLSESSSDETENVEENALDIEIDPAEDEEESYAQEID